MVEVAIGLHDIMNEQIIRSRVKPGLRAERSRSLANKDEECGAKGNRKPVCQGKVHKIRLTSLYVRAI